MKYPRANCSMLSPPSCAPVTPAKTWRQLGGTAWNNWQLWPAVFGCFWAGNVWSFCELRPRFQGHQKPEGQREDMLPPISGLPIVQQNAGSHQEGKEHHEGNKIGCPRRTKKAAHFILPRLHGSPSGKQHQDRCSQHVAVAKSRYANYAQENMFCESDLLESGNLLPSVLGGQECK